MNRRPWQRVVERQARPVDVTWITEKVAVGGGIWNAANMAEIARTGVTHIIDMQKEFDDGPLAVMHGIRVLWNAVDDDFQPKPAEIFEHGVGFALDAFQEPESKVLIHCAAGVHRAPMMTLALLSVLGWKTDEAAALIALHRPVVEFPQVYLDSVEGFLKQHQRSQGHSGVTSGSTS